MVKLPQVDVSPATRDSISLTADILGILAVVWAVTVSLVTFFKKNQFLVHLRRFKKTLERRSRPLFDFSPISLGLAHSAILKKT
jgi:hypothetical protein